MERTIVVMNKLKLSKNLVFFLIGAILLLLLFAGLFIAGAPRSKTQKKAKRGDITQVIIENDTTKLTVKRNGLVEVNTQGRSFYQHWDEERVARLFLLLKNQDFSGFDNRLKLGESGYLVTISTSEGDVVIAISDMGEIPEGLAELIEILEKIEAAAVDDDDDGVDEETEIPTPASSSSPFESPNPSIIPSPYPQYSAYPSVTPTPIPTSTPGTVNQQVPFSCELSDLEGSVNILSETVCNLIN